MALVIRRRINSTYKSNLSLRFFISTTRISHINTNVLNKITMKLILIWKASSIFFRKKTQLNQLNTKCCLQWLADVIEWRSHSTIIKTVNSLHMIRQWFYVLLLINVAFHLQEMTKVSVCCDFHRHFASMVEHYQYNIFQYRNEIWDMRFLLMVLEEFDFECHLF